MANTPSFVQYAVDLLSPLGAVSARAMFGGHGLYAEGRMFGLLDDGELFLKADAESRGAFVTAGCAQWVYAGPHGPMPGGYYRPPPEAMEDFEAMRPWFELAVGAARRKAEGKGKARAKGEAKGKAKAKAQGKSKAKGKAKAQRRG